ncbi:cytochrome P450 [Spirillospora sp. CA-255316]
MTDDRKQTNQFLLDNTDPELRHHLVETLVEMQRKCPVAWSPAAGGFWALSKYDDVVQASQDWQTFSTAQGITIPPTGRSNRAVPLEVDPPEHADFRRLLQPSFTPKAIQKWEDGIRAIVEECFAPLVARGHGDVAAEVAKPVPVKALCLVLGITSDWQKITDIGERYLSGAADFEHPERVRAVGKEMEEFLGREVEMRRGKPVEDLLGYLINGEVGGKPLDPVDQLGMVTTMIIAGHETTVNAIGSLVHQFMAVPGLREKLLADRSLIGPAIDESLRLHSPVWQLARTVVQDTEVRDVPLCPGERVMLVYGAANQDPDKFPDPETFDTGRPNGTQHVTFGSGRHRCLGEALAKLELRVVLEYVLDHVPDIQPDGDAVWGGQIISHGPAALPVTLPARS